LRKLGWILVKNIVAVDEVIIAKEQRVILPQQCKNNCYAAKETVKKGEDFALNERISGIFASVIGQIHSGWSEQKFNAYINTNKRKESSKDVRRKWKWTYDTVPLTLPIKGGEGRAKQRPTAE